MAPIKKFGFSFWLCPLFYSFFWSAPAAAALEDSFIRLAKKVRPSVVNISITQERDKNLLYFGPGFYPPRSAPPLRGSGSGFIIDKDGLIVTNAHVVSRSDKIQIQFDGDEKMYPAKVLGKDRLSDIALLKVSAKKQLKPVVFGDSQKLQVGEWVAAIGNPHGFGHTMTKGIISAVQRKLDDLNLFPLLQTDASINQGNSGGPLVNLKGEVVGVNNAIAAGATGIGFAIPINNVKTVLKDLRKYGYARRGFIGVQFRPLKYGALVTNVVKGGPAEKAGVQTGDQIVKFGGQELKKPNDLPRAVDKTPVGKKTAMIILRNGKERTLFVSPRITEEGSFSFASPKGSGAAKPKGGAKKLRGVRLSGGFEAAAPSQKILSHFGLPDLGAKHPVAVSLQPSSAAGKAGMKPGDMIFKANGKSISSVGQLKAALQKGVNQLHLLRYHRYYDQYLAFVIGFTL